MRSDTWVVHLETPNGPVYVATDDADTADLDGPVLTRSEVDGLLSVVSRVAPPDYYRRTLWLELNALVALKRSLLIGGPGPAAFLEPGAMRGQTVDVRVAADPVPDPPAPEHEQLGLL